MNYKIISLLLFLGAAAIIIVPAGKRFLNLVEFNEISKAQTQTSKTIQGNSPISSEPENEILTINNDVIVPDKTESALPQKLNEKLNAGQTKVKENQFKQVKIIKTDNEWRKILTPDQFYVLREKGTEPPFSGEYNDNHQTGDYFCRACHLKLFSSKTKFDSHSGWPSFYQPVSKSALIEEIDNEFETARTEVLCSRCHSHLGHVFTDGPKPSGLRYCINSIALEFEKYK